NLSQDRSSGRMLRHLANQAVLCRAGFALACLGAAAGAAAGTFVDTFDSGVIDPTWWTVGKEGTSTVDAVRQRIELTQGDAGFAGLGFTLPISGDFTVSIDYELLNWPAENRLRLALGAVVDPSHQLLIERVSDSRVGLGSEVYVTDFTGQGILGTPTTDRTGTLRLQRSGDKVTGAYLRGAGWNVIGTYDQPAEGAVSRSFGFALFPGDGFTPGVKVAVDNFVLSGPQVPEPVPVPEPATLALVGAGLAGLALARRRRGDR
ncbi:MAG TPA: PEP-CTERM sorting domain-containing protein, partial [Rubrivivax sp.]|nr:PEP-CTERM sorting domain-containing protein [Rubrivivax sp.]